MHSDDEIRNHIKSHISDQGGIAVAEIGDECDFIAESLLDSFSALTLIVSLEATFGVRFDPVELAAESARTVAGLAAVVARKQREP